MVNTNPMEAVMNTSKTIRKSIIVAALALAMPAVAGAQPVGGGTGEPLNEPPVGKFTITPNPALVTTQPQAQARAFPGVDRAPIFGSGDVVKFDASASTDDDGITKYEWDLDGNGTYELSGANLKKTSRSYSQVGTYQIHLRVTDGGNKKDIVVHPLTVHAPPKAQLVPDKTIALIGQQVNYNGAGSSDDNGAIAKYEWDLDGDGTYETNSGTTPAASTSYTTIGTKSVKLRVTDIHGATGTAAVNVLVHRAPTAAFTIAPNPAVVDQAVTFDGSTSSDDDPIAKYEWDLDGDGTFETDTLAVATATKTYTTPGAVTVKLRTTDDHGVQDVVSHQLTVNPKPTTTTTTTTTDTTAPVVTITPGSAKLARNGNVTLKVACPMGESTCTGRLALRSLRGARSAALGGKAFSLAGGKTATVRIHLSKKNQKAVKRLRRMKAQATATATDAAGNTGTARKVVTIKR
jgi:hypothetical protein